MWIVVLFGTIYLFGIFSLVVDAMLEKRSLHKANSIPAYHTKSSGGFEYKVILDDLDNDESFTVL